ncbi:MAG: hypothetical protein JNM07_10565 [Phycisphaerae bacterium]|nr:hypothetical protein [Phycisphaerae bacterium]
MAQRKFIQGLIGLSVACGAFACTGCQSGGGASLGDAPTEAPRSLDRRPVASADGSGQVWVAAAEMYPDSDSQELDFYEELAGRDVASHDDVLHAMLLVGTGKSPGTYGLRVAEARRRGWLRDRFDRPGREAATVGEAAKIMVRLLGDSSARDEESATRRAQELDAIPASFAPGQTLSGPQLLALMLSVHDMMGVGAAGGVAPAPVGRSSGRGPRPSSDGHAAERAELAPSRAGRAPEESFDDFSTAAPTPPAAASARKVELVVAARPNRIPAGAAATRGPRPTGEPLPSIPGR